MDAWQELQVKSTAPAGSDAWVHLISQSPGGGLPGEGINAAMPVTGTVTFTGHPPVFDTQLAPLVPVGELKVTGYPPTFIEGGPALVEVPTGSLMFVEYALPPVLDPDRAEVVGAEYRYEVIPGWIRYDVVVRDYRYEQLDREYRYEVVPAE